MTSNSANSANSADEQMFTRRFLDLKFYCQYCNDSGVVADSMVGVTVSFAGEDGDGAFDLCCAKGHVVATFEEEV